MEQVVPGIKKLKALQLEGQTVKVDRYRPLQQEGDSAYDKVTGEFAAHRPIQAMLLLTGPF